MSIQDIDDISHIVVLCVFQNGRLMCEVNDNLSYEKFKVSQTILPKRGTIRKTQTYQHVLHHTIQVAMQSYKVQGIDPFAA